MNIHESVDMRSRRYRFSFLTALLISLVLSTSGCQILDRLKARNHLNKGVKAYSGQRYEEAVEEFQEAVALDPELLNAQLYLATTYRSQWTPGVYSDENAAFSRKAVETFQKVLEQDPGNTNAMANIAGIYNADDQPDKAKEWYRRRLEVDPDNPEPYYGLGTINWKLAHDETGMNGDGVEYLEETDRIRVTIVVDEGVAALEKALEINEDYTDAMQYLNLMYRERAYLAQDEEEKRKWEIEAGRLALRAMEATRRQQEEDERARHSFGAEEQD